MAATTTTHALATPVFTARTDTDDRVGPQWIGVGDLSDDGGDKIGIMIRSGDGVCLVAELDALVLDDFAGQLATILARRTRGLIEPLFPVHQ